MEIKIEIKSLLGKVLFEYSKEYNTVKDTLEEAVRRGANLRGAYLDGANLDGANLRGAYLRGANLDGAYLRGAYLDGANLRGAYLRGANLDGAYLGGAYLDGANLDGAYLGGAYLDGAGKLNSIDDILIVGPIGSPSAYTQIYRTDNGVYVKCGCFFGTLAEFADKVRETHAGSKYERDYNALIEYAKIRFDIKK